MIGKKQKTSLYVIAFASMLLATFFIFSCSNDEYFETQKTDVNGTNKTRALLTRMASQKSALIDSVASSDEFWEFEMSSKRLADKFKAYTSKCGQEKYDELMNNLNNDDYLEELIKLASLENELAQIGKAKENLFKNTGFLRLSGDERTELFLLFAKSDMHTGINKLKTRSEGSSDSECQKLKDEAYTQAKSDFDNSIVRCKGDLNPYLCYMNLSAIYDKDTRRADKEYEECINKK